MSRPTAADPRIVAPAPPPFADGPVLSPQEFRERNRLSRTKFFELKRDGLGPRTMLNGSITLEAERDWRREMEKAATTERAKLEHARRVELARRAGRAAAASPLHVSKQKKRKAKRRAS